LRVVTISFAWNMACRRARGRFDAADPKAAEYLSAALSWPWDPQGFHKPDGLFDQR
jgi:hypothetical protein